MENLFDLIKDNPLALVTFSAILAVMAGVRSLGLWQGQNAPKAPNRILGAVIDSKKADELIAAVNKLAVGLNDNTAVARELRITMQANSTAMVSVGDDLTQVRGAIGDLTLELVRSPGR